MKISFKASWCPFTSTTKECWAPRYVVRPAKFWLEAAKMQVDAALYRVESHANIADGPSRLFFDLLVMLQSSA